MSDDDDSVVEVAAKIAAPPVEPEVASVDLVDKANVAAERLEKANAELKGLIAKQERLQVESLLGGKTDAGSAPKSAEALEIAEAKKLLLGSGFEDELFPDE